MNDLISISDEIQKKIRLLSETRGKLKQAGDAKAKTISEYDKAVAICLINLRNGKTITVDGVDVVDPPASYGEKVAKGACWEQRLAMEMADNYYKSLITFINCIESELSAAQSLFRTLDNV